GVADALQTRGEQWVGDERAAGRGHGHVVGDPQCRTQEQFLVGVLRVQSGDGDTAEGGAVRRRARRPGRGSTGGGGGGEVAGTEVSGGGDGRDPGRVGRVRLQFNGAEG